VRGDGPSVSGRGNVGEWVNKLYCVGVLWNTSLIMKYKAERRDKKIGSVCQRKRERERVCVCVCQSERKKERDIVCLSEEREIHI
jgi:hypothetical protein